MTPTPIASASSRLLPLLRHVRPVYGSECAWRALCPAHDDHGPSLHVTQTPDRVLLKCFTGCTAHDVVRAIGWRLGDLYDAPRRPQTPRQRLERRAAVNLERWRERELATALRKLRQHEYLLNVLRDLYRAGRPVYRWIVEAAQTPIPNLVRQVEQLSDRSRWPDTLELWRGRAQ